MPPAMPPDRRVLQLNFGDTRITTWNALTGTISPALANLTGATPTALCSFLSLSSPVGKASPSRSACWH